jgi:predicted nucleotidyltransferase
MEMVTIDRKTILQQVLQRLVGILKASRNTEKIVLFGSLSSGTVREDSDLDLVVVEQTASPFWQRQREMRRRLRPRIGVDLLVYTPAEFEQLCRERPFFRDEVVAKGKVIYEQSQ